MSRLTFLIIFIAVIQVYSFSNELKLVTLQYPPYEYEENNEIKGVAVEIVKEVFRRMGQPVNIKLLPWVRAVAMVENGLADGFFTVYKTPEREVFAHYSKEVLIMQVISFFVKEDSLITFNGDLKKLRKYKIGVVRGVSYGEKFDNAVKDKILTDIEDVTIGEQNFYKLISSRIDIIVSNKFGAIHIIDRLNMRGEIKELDPIVQTVPSYIAFSRKKGLVSLRDKFDKTLRDMKNDGTYDEIIYNFFNN